MMKYAEKWDLENLFSGGSRSNTLQQELDRIRSGIASLESLKTPAHFSELVERMQDLDASLRECDAFIICLQSQDSGDEQAGQLRAAFTALEADFLLFSNRFDTFLIEQDGASCQSEPIRFILEERRARARMKLYRNNLKNREFGQKAPQIFDSERVTIAEGQGTSENQKGGVRPTQPKTDSSGCFGIPCDKEDLITQLSIDGYHSWGELYPMLVSEIKVESDGKSLSFGQAENKLTDPDRKVREKTFHHLEAAWKGKGALFSQVLNSLSGFRLQVYKQRGWSDALQEPLFENRMSKETLEALWSAVAEFKKPLLEYMHAKAGILGIDKLAWYDIDAPLFETQAEKIPYDSGAEIVINSLEQFHPGMGEFARKACSEKWVEAEDRSGKRPGGFCVMFPKSKQSRIFMTYSGTMVNISTLAHEIGHAYHNAMVEDLPPFAQNYRMNIAETASTFAEHILGDALLKQAKTREEKLKILSDRIQRSLVFMMNIHARFLFETQFYEERKNKFFSQEELCSLMQKAQEEAFCNGLSTYHPYFWAAKLHFYFTGVPFYNFPYTFGYLLSQGIYNWAKKEGPVFADRYDALLRESGMMTVEDLIQKHLGLDLTKPDFWRDACSAAVADVEIFLALAKDHEGLHMSGLGKHVESLD